MARSRRDVQRRRPLASREARGYGNPHRTTRDAYVARFIPGQPCAIGGEPLWQHTLRKWCDLLDLAHDHVHGGYLGLSCQKHNRGEAATRRNRMQGQRRAIAKAAAIRNPTVTIPGPLRTSRNW